jgi:hypothetical protein
MSLRIVKTGGAGTNGMIPGADEIAFRASLLALSAVTERMLSGISGVAGEPAGGPSEDHTSGA